MKTKKDIEIEIVELGSIKNMVQAFEEIAASRIQRTRSAVLQNRAFLGGVSEVFQQVKTSYRHQVEAILKKARNKEALKQSFLRNNGKTVYVLISANTGLYGDLINNTTGFFASEVKKNTVDVTIIGRLGKVRFDTLLPGYRYTYFDLPDTNPMPSDIAKIAQHLLSYERVIAFHGQFQSVVTQKPIMTTISGEYNAVSAATEAPPTERESVYKYIFEPSLEHIMTVFEQEIFASIFEHAVHESNLAKYASRMILLSSAVENIEKNISDVGKEKLRLMHQNINRKQQSVLSSISLWSK